MVGDVRCYCGERKGKVGRSDGKCYCGERKGKVVRSDGKCYCRDRKGKEEEGRGVVILACQSPSLPFSCFYFWEPSLIKQVFFFRVFGSKETGFLD